MTIRYTCTGCESVLKIKDEKAGTKGKCPKCKAEFLVPDPVAPEDDGIEIESEKADEPADLVDMPIELTPEVEASEDFDPMAVLGGPSGSAGTAKRPSSPAAGTNPPARKPSVAEMMKDLEASKKKEKEKKSAPEILRPMASSALETSGSAADALSRAYQQKRDSASAPSISVKDAKAAEKKALLVDFIKTRAAPGLIVIMALLYGYYWWMTHEAYVGPPLYDVSGQILLSGNPARGIQIYFEPILEGQSDLRGTASGTTDENGNFTLMYDASFSGAPLGEYNVGLQGQNGLPVIPSEGALKLTVTKDGPNEFKINL